LVSFLQAILIAFIGLAGTLLGARISVVTRKKIAREDRESQFRLAAIDKRLKVHQTAFKLWSELMTNLEEEIIFELARKSENWWYENCLYLTPEARKSFKKVTINVSRYYKIDDPKEKDKLYQQIKEVGNIIVKGVELPSIGEYEIMRVNDIKNDYCKKD